MTTKIVVDNTLWKGIIAILAMIAVGVGIWAYQTSKQLTLGWDAIPANPDIIAVRIYDIALTPEVMIAEVACLPAVPCPTQITFTMPKAAHTYIARYASTEWESDNSNSVSIAGPPPKPTGLIKK